MREFSLTLHINLIILSLLGGTTHVLARAKQAALTLRRDLLEHISVLNAREEMESKITFHLCFFPTRLECSDPLGGNW